MTPPSNHEKILSRLRGKQPLLKSPKVSLTIEEKKMVYQNLKKMYGPYLGPEGRLRIHLIFKDGSRKGMSYPKFLMEKSLDRYLSPEETIDHIDKNPLNNELSNLQVLIRTKHSSLDAKRLKEKTFFCPECTKKFTKSGRALGEAISNRKKGKAGPFCSRSCAGKYGKKIQQGGEKLSVNKIKREYTTLKELSVKKT